MDAVEFLKAAERRSKSNHSWGRSIPLYENDYEAFVAQVEQWAKDHPVKTRQSEFLKMFPNAPLFCGVVGLAPCKVDNTLNCRCNRDCSLECHRDYWLQEVE